jgi:hypothetical protein
LLPLVTERLVGNIAALYDGITNVLVKRRYVARQLYGNARNELACMPNISTAAREEKTGAKTPLLVQVCAGDGSRNRRLSCPC